jgi:hypothetical protein
MFLANVDVIAEHLHRTQRVRIAGEPREPIEETSPNCVGAGDRRTEIDHRRASVTTGLADQHPNDLNDN